MKHGMNFPKEIDFFFINLKESTSFDCILKATLEVNKISRLDILPNISKSPHCKPNSLYTIFPKHRPLFQEAQRQLLAYFKGQLQYFSLPLSFSGTDFQCAVWSKLKEIPYGTTWSYGRLADEIGCPKAFRAVGTAVGKNPLPILIPCHRVIPKSGGIGGYLGGAVMKGQLLQLESMNQSKNI